MSKHVTLSELESHYSIMDLADLHEAIEIDAEAKAFYSKVKG